MKTMIAIPCMDRIHTAFVQCLMQSDVKPLGQVSIRFQKNTLVYDGRNILAIEAIQNGYDQVLWLDSDITFPENMPRIMTDTLVSSGADMVTGVYVNRHVNPHPILYSRIAPPEPDTDGIVRKQVETLEDVPRASVFLVAGAGFGCVLTTTALLRDVMGKYGPPFTPLPWASEDISFCYRVGQLGKRIVATTQFPIGHIGQYEYTLDDVRGEQHETTSRDPVPPLR